jgi:hypothetical protein
MKRTLLLLLAFAPLLLVFGQYESVMFDYELAYFNNGQPLPAEEYLIISGEMNANVKRVEVEIHRANSNLDKQPQFMATWKRTAKHDGGSFRLPINYLLKGSSKYSFRFSYFQPVSEAERTALKSSMFEILDTYLANSITLNGENIEVKPNAKKIQATLNTLVADGMYYYRSGSETSFQGFSDLGKELIQKLDGSKSSPEVFAQQLLDIQQLVRKELEQSLNQSLLIRTDVREVFDYPTDKVMSTLAINAGYGGVYLDGDESNFSYGTSPYVGISLPLSSSALAARFWQNTSLSVGVFTNNFEQEEIEYTGPIFGRPYYVGLGYNVFRFIRINAGVTALEKRDASSAGGGTISLDVDAISLRPFIGISAEINIWAGLSQRR